MSVLRYVGISSSPRHANTEVMVRTALEEAKAVTEAAAVSYTHLDVYKRQRES